MPPSVRNSPEPSCGSVFDVVVLMLFYFLLLSWRISDQHWRHAHLGERVKHGPMMRLASSTRHSSRAGVIKATRAASGHAAAAPPSVAKNFRRSMWLTM